MRDQGIGSGHYVEKVALPLFLRMDQECGVDKPTHPSTLQRMVSLIDTTPQP